MKQFRKLGDHLLLDFCNTWILHRDHEEELLDAPIDLELWSKEFLSVRYELSGRQFTVLLELRSHFRIFFERLLEGKNKLTPDFATFLLRQSLHIEQTSPGFFSLTHSSPLLGKLLEHFFTFSRVIDTNRLKKCANPNCSHLFYDVSKNNRRQWCTMQSCGNVMKVRAFYARKKLQKESRD